jgi:hypothetical protein
LETRTAPAVITVTTGDDDITRNDGWVSLREAITAMNAGNDLGDPDIQRQNPVNFGSSDKIQFAIGNDFWIVNVSDALGALPTITDNGLTITGATPARPSGTVQIEGAAFGNAGKPGVAGLTVTADDVTIDHLGITNFTGDGIYIKGGASHNVIKVSYIVGNTGCGINVDNSSLNQIGTVDTEENENDIGGNGQNGIIIRGSGAFGNSVVNSYIHDNSIYGVQITSGSTGNLGGAQE